MNKNWSRKLSTLLVLLAALMVPRLAYAHSHWGKDKDPDDGRRRSSPSAVSAPELDPRLALEGFAVAGAAAVLMWEKIRTRR